jgi:hypothetical protein
MPHGTNGQIFGSEEQNLKTTRSDYQPGNCAQQQENEVKTAIVAMLLATATVALIDVAAPTPAEAGWCYEACGRSRPVTRTCVTEKIGNTYVTRCY